MTNVRFVLSLAFLCLAPALAYGQTADKWDDISSANISRLGKQPWPGGCAGCAVNRLSGDVMVNFVGFGLWKSSNQGQTWTRLDQGVIGGRGESGWSVQVDQNDPRRVAVFSLDGDAGYTIDGRHWKKFKDMGRNWDFGSVDWASPGAEVILAGKHESGGEVYKSTDGGTTWIKLPIVMNPVAKKDNCMIGVMDSKTFVYSYANGIQRSTDEGATWSKVSEFQPQSKVPVLFHGTHYLCTSGGLIVSKNHGATWQAQGEPVDMWQGPFFGADEKTMVAAGPKGVYKTTNAGKTWAKVSALRTNLDPLYTYAPQWFGGYCWDPVNDVIYATAMSHPAFKNRLASSQLAAAPPAPGDQASTVQHEGPVASDLKFESVTLKDGGPAATIHILCRAVRMERRPAILMLGSLTPGRPPDWSTGLLNDGYMLVAFSVAHPPDADSTRRPQWLVFDERFAHSYVLGGHRAATDTRRVIEYLSKRGDVNLDKIGWIGSSSSGIPGLAVATQGPRLAAVVVFVSTGAYAQWLDSWHTNGLWRGKSKELWPETKELLKYDPVRHVENMYPAALLMVNGGEDKIVDPASARTFVKAAQPFYEKDPNRLQLVVYENFGDNLPLDVVTMHAEHWFRLYMHPTRPPPQPVGKPGTLPESVRKSQINSSDHKNVVGAGE